MRWVSADGLTVASGTPPLHPDTDGVLWPLDPETGLVDLDATFTFRRYAYTEEDCQGTEYAYELPLPRMAASGAAFEMDGSFYVRPDAGAVVQIELASLKYTADGGCSPAAIDVLALPFSELRTVQPPAVSWQGPLHLEVAL